MQASASGKWLALGLSSLLLLAGCGGHMSRDYGEPSGLGGGGANGVPGATKSSTGGTPAELGGVPATSVAGAGAAQAGSPDTAHRSKPSSGCGKPLPFEQVPTVTGTRAGYTEYRVTQTGATLGVDEPNHIGERQFFVRVPVDYEPNRPYRVIYIGQGCGAQRAGDKNTYPLFNEAMGGDEQAVYVGLSVPDNDANPGCYDNNSGPQSQEWEAFDLIHSVVESTYCVDNDRIYVAGYSTGGWLANMWGCYFAGTPAPPLDQPDVDAGRMLRKFAPRWAIRGHASVSGSLPPNQPLPCNGPAAGLWLHDIGDKSSLIDTEVPALELALKNNGCVGDYENGPKRAWPLAEGIPDLGGGICQLYVGCPADVTERYPLVFCTTQGRGHSDMSQLAVPLITRFFEALDPK